MSKIAFSGLLVQTKIKLHVTMAGLLGEREAGLQMLPLRTAPCLGRAVLGQLRGTLALLMFTEWRSESVFNASHMCLPFAASELGCAGPGLALWLSFTVMDKMSILFSFPSTSFNDTKQHSVEILATYKQHMETNFSSFKI